MRIVEIILGLTAVVAMSVVMTSTDKQSIALFAILTLVELFYLIFFGRIVNGRKKEDLKNPSKYPKWLSFLLALSIALGLLGINMRISWWPLSTPTIQISTVLWAIATALMLAKYLKIKSPFLLMSLTRNAVFGALILFFFFSSHIFIDSLGFRKYPSYMEAYYIRQADPDNEEKIQAFFKERDRITQPDDVFEMLYNESK